MKKSGNKTIKFLAAMSTLIFSGCVAFTASLAWFSSKRAAENAASGFQVAHSELIEEVKFYPYHTLTAGEGTASKSIYTFEKEAQSEIDLGKYSRLRGGYQILLEVTLTDYASQRNNLKFSGESSAERFLGEINPETGKLYTLLQHEGNSLSSIVCFYGASEDEIVDQGTYYSYNVNSSNKTNFVKEENQKEILNSKVTVSTISKQNHFFVVLDYDVANIEKIYSLNLGNPVLSDISSMDAYGETYLEYSNDFHFSLSEGQAD